MSTAAAIEEEIRVPCGQNRRRKQVLLTKKWENNAQKPITFSFTSVLLRQLKKESELCAQNRRRTTASLVRNWEIGLRVRVNSNLREKGNYRERRSCAQNRRRTTTSSVRNGEIGLRVGINSNVREKGNYNERRRK